MKKPSQEKKITYYFFNNLFILGLALFLCMVCVGQFRDHTQILSHTSTNKFLELNEQHCTDLKLCSLQGLFGLEVGLWIYCIQSQGSNHLNHQIYNGGPLGYVHFSSRAATRNDFHTVTSQSLRFGLLQHSTNFTESLNKSADKRKRMIFTLKLFGYNNDVICSHS